MSCLNLLHFQSLHAAIDFYYYVGHFIPACQEFKLRSNAGLGLIRHICIFIVLVASKTPDYESIEIMTFDLE